MWNGGVEDTAAPCEDGWMEEGTEQGDLLKIIRTMEAWRKYQEKG